MHPQSVEYDGYKFRMQTSGRYYQGEKYLKPERLLHRYVWHKYNGAIPQGFHVHHIDGNWANNEISNLECVNGIEHIRQHTTELMKDPIYRQKALNGLKNGQVAAKKWHASEEGRVWHTKHALECWKNKKKTRKSCVVCNNDFESVFAARESTRFCSRKCATSGNYAKQKTLLTICAWCNTEFLANKYRNVKCCSKVCSNRKRAHDSKIVIT